MEYPKNISDYFTNAQDKKFALWAFGIEQPGSNIKMIQCWEKLHPEYPIREVDSMFICICKMNYIYQMLKNINDLIDYKEIQTMSPEEKLKNWGDGEWVNEKDEITFLYREYECRIIRVFYENRKVFGGHLCGYIKIPENHKFYAKHYDDIDLSVHGGLTYSAMEENGFWIGFDCAHFSDITPSSKELDSIFSSEEFYQKNNFKLEYRNVNFVIEEIKKMVNQLYDFIV